jgi:uncharacterized repeat protein (TIGR03803 family)
VILDDQGNLYGTTILGGAYNRGTVFEVPAGEGPNGPDKILYSFNAADYRGYHPFGGLVFDPSGNLYGTTTYGGHYRTDLAYQGGGKIFEMLPHGDRAWTVKALHDFGGQEYNGFTGIDGFEPTASMIFGADGNLYGTTSAGGYHPGDPDSVGGTVFELKLH